MDSIYSPGGQSAHAVEPTAAPYLPARQSLHALTFDSVEYLPTAHPVHVVAPMLVPVFVIEPAVHVVHAATFDAFEYLPTEHCLHATGPPVPNCPAEHGLQFALGWVEAAAHAVPAEQVQEDLRRMSLATADAGRRW